jgi:hypothetical protein
LWSVAEPRITNSQAVDSLPQGASSGKIDRHSA